MQSQFFVRKCVCVESHVCSPAIGWCVLQLDCCRVDSVLVEIGLHLQNILVGAY